jgi:predicted DNA-binding transcriptional regulator AlpA
MYGSSINFLQKQYRFVLAALLVSFRRACVDQILKPGSIGSPKQFKLNRRKNRWIQKNVRLWIRLNKNL